jgi:hypothetical protein
MQTKSPTRRRSSAGSTGPAALAVPAERRVCPKCGKTSAFVMGRSESYAAVLYLRCEACHDTSVAPA